MKIRTYAAALCAFILAAGAAAADEQHSMHMNHETMGPSAIPDTRELVHFPEMLREHTLASMRDHLLTLSRIQDYLSKHEFDQAGKLAEERLGMSSLPLHGAHEVAPYMPKGMQEAGTAMHRAASRFAIATQRAAIDNDVAGALGALNEVTQACVACHAAYRLR
jgi:cytochrome c556